LALLHLAPMVKKGSRKLIQLIIDNTSRMRDLALKTLPSTLGKIGPMSVNP
jgi:hypothetical protein